MVASSAMVVLLQLGLQAIKQIGVHAGIDFAQENLFSTLDRQRRHLLAQASRALTICWSASTLAAAMILLPSSVAFDLASSTMAWPRRSASARRAAVSVRELANSASIR